MTITKMFPFITKTWNPIGGECQIKCNYCWARGLIFRYNMKKYQGPARLFEMELNQKFKESDFVFVSDMRDMFEASVSKADIQKVLDFITQSPAKFLLLTKNPSRYLEFNLPPNCVAGATIETDIGDNRLGRILALKQLDHFQKMVSIEPIMAFTGEFPDNLAEINNLSFVAVGYDNYNHNLDEPYLEETTALIHMLESRDIKVYQKTLREKAVKGSYIVVPNGINYNLKKMVESPRRCATNESQPTGD